MPYALSIGVDYNLFWHLTPKKLKAFYKAEEMKQKKQDTEMWFMGRYVVNALLCTICNSSLFRKKGSEPFEYPQHPFLYDETEHEEVQNESKEQCAVYEMKQRIRMLEEQGLKPSPK